MPIKNEKLLDANQNTMHYAEQIYAGVLGKIIGVYVGRPVEGWRYDAIQARFGEVAHYVAPVTGAPLIVPDDDISGAFVFYRALEDNDYPPQIRAQQIGDTWLNYVIEDKTILWWGGLSRSTEHTAWLRLQAGIPAPESGSMALNGRSMAEQIGAQIFIDTWAMANPGDPERAVAMAREAASVSHDGLAVDAACFLAALESLAFDQPDLTQLLLEGQRFITGTRLRRLVDDTLDACARADDWRTVRAWIARHHDYDRYPGNCPMATNHAALLMALVMGGDNFQKALTIAASAGWDTDCNAGNVGCLNAIRLGLDAIDAEAPFRPVVADQMLVVSADGGECITDAVRESRKLIQAAAALRGEEAHTPRARFAFEQRGSVQGWQAHPEVGIAQALTTLRNIGDAHGGRGLEISYAGLARGMCAALSVKTFVDPEPKGRKGTSYFEVIASPSLYATQTVCAVIECSAQQNPAFSFFIDYYDGEGDIRTIYGKETTLATGSNRLAWEVPDTQGHPVYRLGIRLTSPARLDGSLTLKQLDWSAAPRHLHMGRSMELTPSLTPWTTMTPWLTSFVTSARHFAPDYTATFAVSHPQSGGVVTLGTRDWRDYAVSSLITFSQQRAAGLVIRARGHKRYYAGRLVNGYAQIIKQRDDETIILAQTPLDWALDETHFLEIEAAGAQLTLSVDGVKTAAAQDDDYRSGGAGYIVDEGAIVADGFTIKQSPQAEQNSDDFIQIL